MPRSSSRTAASSPTPTARRRRATRSAFGRPMIEAYFGGSHAAALETGGEHAFFDFAASELGGLVRQRVRAPRQADSAASLGRRSLRARLLFLRAAGPGRLPCGARRAGRRPAVFRRRGLLARAISRPRMAAVHRNRRGRTGDHGCDSACRPDMPRARFDLAQQPATVFMRGPPHQLLGSRVG